MNADDLKARKRVYVQTYAEGLVASGTQVHEAIRLATESWDRRIAAEAVVAAALDKEERTNG